MLVAYKKKHPTMICRIVILTDGEDNESTTTPFLTPTRLLSNQITQSLFSIVKHTGGYAFNPKPAPISSASLFSSPL